MAAYEDHRPRVVIADDHPLVLEAFQQILQRDCDVLAAVSNGSSAIDTVNRLRPDILVVDLMLADVDGLEVCRRVKSSVPDTHVVIVTAFDDDEVRKIALDNGAAAYVPKYEAASTLVSTIRQLCNDDQKT